MTGATFTSYVHKLTGTNASTFPVADILVFANIEQASLAEDIASNVDEAYFLMEDVRNLEADERSYTYPVDFLKGIKYVSAKLDGTNWLYLRETDFGYIEGRKQPLMENTTIKSEYAQKSPEYLLNGNEIMILSGADIIAVTSGLKIMSEVYPEDLDSDDLSGSVDLSIASTTTAVRLPRAGYKALAKMVSIAYKTSKDKPLPLTEDERLLPVDKSELYNKLRGRNAVRVITGKVPHNDGQQY